jgi:hypothetical protein
MDEHEMLSIDADVVAVGVLVQATHQWKAD